MADVTYGTYYIETYGCQMNDHDSEKMAALLEGIGLERATSPEGTDVVVINTCSIREKAEHKVYSALGTLKGLKCQNPQMVTVVSGCVAQQEGGRLLRRAEYLDLVLGTHCIAELPRMVERVRSTGDRFVRTEFCEDAASLHVPAPTKGIGAIGSYVTIMQGCSNFCAYCVVPFTRGPEQSRPEREILREVEDLANKDVKEITLLGQNVNAYGNHPHAGCSFAELLQILDRVNGLNRLRFTTSHPRDFHDDLIDAMAGLETVCEHIHLPLQAGSDRVLTAMRRGYSREEYLHKIRRLRERIPGVAITADIIVGFPGETEDDFQETLEALEEIRYHQIFSFKYSARPGTAAARFPDHLPDGIKTERLARVHEVQERITLAYHKAAEGTGQEVLVEGFRAISGQPFGRTRTNKIVNLISAEGIGQGDLVRVRITQGLKHSLKGEILP